MRWECRKVNGPMVITDWVDFPEAGETMESLQKYLDRCFNHTTEIFMEDPFTENLCDSKKEHRWGIDEGPWQGYQFRIKEC